MIISGQSTYCPTLLLLIFFNSFSTLIQIKYFGLTGFDNNNSLITLSMIILNGLLCIKKHL